MSDFTYRVQEYTLDMGVFHKSSIYELPFVLYHNTNNDSRSRRLVILPPDDLYAEKLPSRVRSWDEMVAIIQKYERLELKRCRAEEALL